MFSIDDEARNYFNERIKANQVLRVFFGGYG